MRYQHEILRSCHDFSETLGTLRFIFQIIRVEELEEANSWGYFAFYEEV